MFKKETYSARRKALHRLMPTNGIILFPSNNEASFNYPSNTYRYRQDSNFNYFFGQMRDGMVGVMDLNSGTDTLYGDSYTIDDIIWMGDQPSVKDMAAKCGVENTFPSSELAQLVSNTLKNGQKVHYLPPYRDDTRIFLHKLIGCALDDVKINASQELIDEVVTLRAVKTEEEILELDKVCDLGVEMHLAVMHSCRAGATEREMAGLAEGIALSGGTGVSFPVIMSQNGETLHNHNHDQTLTEGRLLLMDMGAESVTGYASDYTRTIPVSGKFTQKQREIYQIVLRANMESIAMARPNIRYWDVHLHAVTIITEGLTQLGLMKGDHKAAALAGAHALFMPHGLGHMLGMDVHDMEGLGEDNVGYDSDTKRSEIFGHRSLRCGRQLHKGFVLTVEPGIYFIPHLIDVWEKAGKFTEFINYDKVREYIGFGGIRIEDDIVITETGCRVLGSPLPKSVEEIELLMAR